MFIKEGYIRAARSAVSPPQIRRKKSVQWLREKEKRDVYSEVPASGFTFAQESGYTEQLGREK